MNRRVWTALIVTAAALAVPAGARAETATIGSPLTAAPESASCGTATFATTRLAAPAILKAPFDGMILRWRMVILNPNPSPSYRLRVLQQQGTGYIGDGTGPLQGAPSAGLNVISLPNPIPIHAGEIVGIDCPTGASSPLASVPTSTQSFFDPVLGDGGTARTPNNSFAGEEILVNADIASVPSNIFSLGTPTRNKRRGTAMLPVTVPGPGSLTLSGDGILAQAAGRPAVESVSGPGSVNLLIAATGKKRRKLKRKGKAAVLASVTYTPTGDLPGTPNTHSAQITLRKKRKKRP